ncbi:exopolyphosphatase [Azorhizobium oxalatiphilum]
MAGEAPVAVIDIGSNSVRLVVYEAITRAPVPLFNEKALCGLGREVVSTGRLAEDAVERAFSALKRFRGLCDAMGVGQLFALATAAARDAENGPAFIAECESICRTSIEILSGRREAELAAFGVISGFHKPEGVVGDLGGGSLELVDVRGTEAGAGITMPVGILALQDRASRSLNKADKIVRDTVRETQVVSEMEGRTFYAVGGTWRALARLHMFQRGYPLHVMHGYRIPAREVADFTRIVHRADSEALAHIEAVSNARRPLLAYGALVLENVVKAGKPADVVISALGVREGLLYSLLNDAQRAEDPLIFAAQEFNILRSRSPRHCEELATWSGAFFRSAPALEEEVQDARLREAACLLSDNAWRAHPDYRAEQSLNVIAHAALVGIDHPGRAFLALSVYYRHMGLGEDEYAPRLLELVSSGLRDRARILGAAMRVAYILSAAMPGILPRVPLRVEEGVLRLSVPADLASLVNDRVHSRVRQLARLIGCTPSVEVG